MNSARVYGATPRWKCSLAPTHQRRARGSLRYGAQARNQLGTPGEAKSFLKGAENFKLCPVVPHYVQQNFSREGERNFRVLRPPGNGPDDANRNRNHSTNFDGACSTNKATLPLRTLISQRSHSKLDDVNKNFRTFFCSNLNHFHV